VYSNVELFGEKHQKTEHCNVLLLLIGNYCYFKNSEEVGQEAILCTEGDILVAFLAFE
jgi:hypothetical protein